MAVPKTIFVKDQEKPGPAVPGHNGCASPGAAITGEITISPAPILTTDAAQVAADPSAIFKELWAINGRFEEPWMAAFNAEIRCGSQAYRNDATGHSYDD